MRLIGVSCDYHDSAAALVVDGEVVAAAEEERFSRIKHDSSLPERAIASCLAVGELGPDEIDAVVVYEKPLAVINRVVLARQRKGPRALGAFTREMPTLLGQNLMVGLRLEQLFRRLGATRPPEIRFSEHHLSHAASAYLPSPFQHAAILTVDGVGEWATASMGHGRHGRIDLLSEQRYPNSLGLLYSLATLWCGFEPNDGEYKLMGLAPFGENRFSDALAEFVHLEHDGSVTVDAKTVDWWSGGATRSRRLQTLLGGGPLPAGEPPTQREADLARSVQDLVERAMLRMATHLHDVTGEARLCMSGGVALNCVANGVLRDHGPFEDIWVQPASGDAGSAVGAALWFAHSEYADPPASRHRRFNNGETIADDSMRGAQLGPRFSGEEIAAWLTSAGVHHRRSLNSDARITEVARRLADGEIIGWFNGRMEFGPRALGHRSILADPRSPTVQRELNLRVKGRESFRPFAPAVLWEHATDWFSLDRPSPYMLFTAQVAQHRRIATDAEPTDFFARTQVVRSEVPACTHVDGSARVQTVHRERSPEFHRLIEAFAEITDCPVLLNTSFNRAGEPVVCTPDDALRSAALAGLDLLVLEDCLIESHDLPHEDSP